MKCPANCDVEMEVLKLDQSESGCILLYCKCPKCSRKFDIQELSENCEPGWIYEEWEITVEEKDTKQ